MFEIGGEIQNFDYVVFVSFSFTNDCTQMILRRLRYNLTLVSKTFLNAIECAVNDQTHTCCTLTSFEVIFWQEYLWAWLCQSAFHHHLIIVIFTS